MIHYHFHHTLTFPPLNLFALLLLPCSPTPSPVLLFCFIPQLSFRKVLNVPYDSALVAVHSSHTAAYRRAFSLSASTAGDEDPSTASLYGGKATSSYHMKENGEGEGETPCWDSTLESLTTVEPCLQNSSRARGISAYAALRTLGQEGLCELVERMARCAAVFAAKATAEVSI